MEYRCEDCTFTCHSEKLYLQHKEREIKGLSEQEEKALIKKKQQRKELRKYE